MRVKADVYLLKNPVRGDFTPYTMWDSCQKTLSVYLAPDEFFVETLNDQIDVFKSLEKSGEENKIVGCRLKLGGRFIELQQDDFK